MWRNILGIQLPSSNSFGETWEVPPLPGSKCDKSNKWPWPGKENTRSLPTDPEDANPRGFTTTKGGRKGLAGMLKKNSEETYFQRKDSIKNSVNDGRCILFSIKRDH